MLPRRHKNRCIIKRKEDEKNEKGDCVGDVRDLLNLNIDNVYWLEDFNLEQLIPSVLPNMFCKILQHFDIIVDVDDRTLSIAKSRNQNYIKTSDSEGTVSDSL